MIAFLDQVPFDEFPGGGGGLLDQIPPTFTVHLVERYWWRWEDTPSSDPQYLGQKRLGTTLRVPFPFDVTVRPIRIYMVTVTENGIVNIADLRLATQVVYPQAPTFTSAAFDTGGLDIDMVFHKNSPATGNITVEYRKVGTSTWLTHATTFAHGATTGSITIAQEATSQTYQLRLKQIGVGNYSRTIEVTVNGSGGGDTAPTFTSITYDSANSEADLVFAKNGSATGNIEVEYKLTSDSTWITHATSFAHGATSGSIVITEQPTALIYDVRLKQVGVAGYSTTRQVTVDAIGGTAPSNLIAVGDDTDPHNWTVDIDWTDGSGDGVYTVQRRVNGSSWVNLTTSCTAVTWFDTVAANRYTTKFVDYQVIENSTGLYSNIDQVIIPGWGIE